MVLLVNKKLLTTQTELLFLTLRNKLIVDNNPDMGCVEASQGVGHQLNPKRVTLLNNTNSTALS